MEWLLQERGLVRAGPAEAADLEVVHTCSVTSTAAAKSRHAVRQAARRRGQAGLCATSPEVIVTGCYASTDSDHAARLAGGPIRVIPHEAADGSILDERFARRVDQWLADRQAHSPLRTPGGGSCRQTALDLPPAPRGPQEGRHVRAELKIQDGCDAHCTFCIIPAIRRTLRSKTVSDAVAEARRLVSLGHREIVLTGIFLGAYGHETALRRRQTQPGGRQLAELLDAVAGVPGLQRLRLSSLEPGDVTEVLLDAMVAHHEVVVPHLHLPLQSGSDDMLRRMNRQYRLGDYLEMIDRVNEAMTTPDGLPPALTTDIICGFPGETTDDFEKTVEAARRVGYLHMHVFPFSPRPGTAAARWTDRFVEPAVIRRRVRRLIDLEHDPEHGLSLQYRRRLLGRTVRLILEQVDESDPAMMTGRCDHYVRISVRTGRPRGAVVGAKVTEVTPEATRGRVLTTDVPLEVRPTAELCEAS